MAKEQEQSSLMLKRAASKLRTQAMLSASKESRGMRAQQAAIEATARRGGGVANILPGDPNQRWLPMGGWLLCRWIRYVTRWYEWPGLRSTRAMAVGNALVIPRITKVGQRTGNYPMYWRPMLICGQAARVSRLCLRVPHLSRILSSDYGCSTHGHVVWVEASKR